MTGHHQQTTITTYGVQSIKKFITVDKNRHRAKSSTCCHSSGSRVLIGPHLLKMVLSRSIGSRILIGLHLLKLVFGRADTRHTRATEANVAEVKHGVLSNRNRSFRLRNLHVQLVVRSQRQAALYQRLAVLVAETAVQRNMRLQSGWNTVNPVRLGG